MCPDEDDVLEKTAAKSNPGNSRGVASMNSFVATKGHPSTSGTVPHQEHKSPRASRHAAPHPITKTASSAQTRTPGTCLISLSDTKSACSRCVKADLLRRVTDANLLISSSFHQDESVHEVIIPAYTQQVIIRDEYRFKSRGMYVMIGNKWESSPPLPPTLHLYSCSI